jgi:hypothetical protein
LCAEAREITEVNERTSNSRVHCHECQTHLTHAPAQLSITFLISHLKTSSQIKQYQHNADNIHHCICHYLLQQPCQQHAPQSSSARTTPQTHARPRSSSSTAAVTRTSPTIESALAV